MVLAFSQNNTSRGKDIRGTHTYTCMPGPPVYVAVSASVTLEREIINSTLSSVPGMQGSPPHKRSFVGCSSFFVRLTKYLTAFRTWCKQMSSCLVRETRSAPSHCRDERVSGHSTTARTCMTRVHPLSLVRALCYTYVILISTCITSSYLHLISFFLV